MRPIETVPLCDAYTSLVPHPLGLTQAEAAVRLARRGRNTISPLASTAPVLYSILTPPRRSRHSASPMPCCAARSGWSTRRTWRRRGGMPHTPHHRNAEHPLYSAPACISRFPVARAAEVVARDVHDLELRKKQDVVLHYISHLYLTCRLL